MITYFVVIITIVCLPLTALSFSFTSKPELPTIVVLNSNSANVDFRWDFSLANGDIFTSLRFQRYEKDKGDGSAVVLGFYQTGFPNIDATFYNLSTNVTLGPSSGYVRFTIKDIRKQRSNKDGSKADPRSIDYVYRLQMNIANILDSQVSDVEQRVLYKPYDPLLSTSQLEVCENKNINFSCVAKASPSVKNYSLYNGNNYLGSSRSGQFSTPATPPEKNTFCCNASNEIGVSQCGYADVFVLGVTTPLCKVNNKTTSVATVNEGDRVVLQCNVSGNESYYMYQWSKVKDGLPSNVSDNERKLTLDSINRTDEGYYQMTLRDILNCSSQTESLNITVNYKPEHTGIKISGDKKVFCEGDSIHVNCTADAKPDPVYSLYRNNVYLNGNANGVFTVTSADKGDYNITCVPNNTVGVGPSKSQSVAVKEQPKITDCRINGSPNTNQPVFEGDVVNVSCSTSGSPPLSGKWTKGGLVLSNMSFLKFNPVDRRDAGSYKFILGNGDECKEAVKDVNITVHWEKTTK